MTGKRMTKMPTQGLALGKWDVDWGQGRSGSRSPSSTKSPQQSHNSKRKMVHKSTNSSKKQKRKIVLEATSNLKHTASGGANLVPTQRYNFYRYFGEFS